ncbi:unnamed protein product [Peniophora sp. CBMAI 1063]|nr:unnamed protein product [Peniophora sp. CBMAI 1063]
MRWKNMGTPSYCVSLCHPQMKRTKDDDGELARAHATPDDLRDSEGGRASRPTKALPRRGGQDHTRQAEPSLQEADTEREDQDSISSLSSGSVRSNDSDDFAFVNALPRADGSISFKPSKATHLPRHQNKKLQRRHLVHSESSMAVKERSGYFTRADARLGAVMEDVAFRADAPLPLNSPLEPQPLTVSQDYDGAPIVDRVSEAWFYPGLLHLNLEPVAQETPVGQPGVDATLSNSALLGVATISTDGASILSATSTTGQVVTIEVATDNLVHPFTQGMEASELDSAQRPVDHNTAGDLGPPAAEPTAVVATMPDAKAGTRKALGPRSRRGPSRQKLETRANDAKKRDALQQSATTTRLRRHRTRRDASEASQSVTVSASRRSTRRKQLTWKVREGATDFDLAAIFDGHADVQRSTEGVTASESAVPVVEETAQDPGANDRVEADLGLRPISDVEEMPRSLAAQSWPDGMVWDEGEAVRHQSPFRSTEDATAAAAEQQLTQEESVPMSEGRYDQEEQEEAERVNPEKIVHDTEHRRLSEDKEQAQQAEAERLAQEDAARTAEQHRMREEARRTVELEYQDRFAELKRESKRLEDVKRAAERALELAEQARHTPNDHIVTNQPPSTRAASPIPTTPPPMPTAARAPITPTRPTMSTTSYAPQTPTTPTNGHTRPLPSVPGQPPLAQSRPSAESHAQSAHKYHPPSPVPPPPPPLHSRLPTPPPVQNAQRPHPPSPLRNSRPRSGLHQQQQQQQPPPAPAPVPPGPRPVPRPQPQPQSQQPLSRDASVSFTAPDQLHGLIFLHISIHAHNVHVTSNGTTLKLSGARDRVTQALQAMRSLITSVSAFIAIKVPLAQGHPALVDSTAPRAIYIETSCFASPITGSTEVLVQGRPEHISKALQFITGMKSQDPATSPNVAAPSTPQGQATTGPSMPPYSGASSTQQPRPSNFGPSQNPGELFDDLLSDRTPPDDPTPGASNPDQEMHDTVEEDGTNETLGGQGRRPSAPAQSSTQCPAPSPQLATEYVTREEFRAYQEQQGRCNAATDPPRPSRGRPSEDAVRKATMKALHIAPPKRQRRTRGGQVNQLRTVLRGVILSLLERPSSKAPFPAHKIPSHNRIAAYTTHGIAGPSKDDWLVDPTAKFATAWNQQAGIVLMDILIENGHIRADERESAWAWFENHHNGTLRSHYNALNVGDERAREANRQRTNKNQRRESLGMSRMTVCSSRNALAEVGEVLNDVGARSTVHSDDEEDHESASPRYGIVDDKDWRADLLRKFFRHCDVLHLGAKFDEGGLHRTAPGNWFRVRVPKPGAVSRSSFPVPGLPSNFYDSSWVAMQSPERLAWLDMKPEVPLDFPLELRIQAARILGILRVDGAVSDWRTLRVSQAELAMLDEYLDTGRRPPATYGAL